MLAQVSPFARIRWSVALAASFALSASYIDRQALSVLAPTVRDALGIDHRGYGALTGAFSLAFLIGAPLASRIVDRLGPRSGLALSLVVWSVVSALHGMASSFVALLLLRVLLGASEAPSLPGAARAVRRVLPPGSRSAGYSLLFTGSSLGAIIAAPLVIGLKMALGWQWAFVAVSLIGLLWLPLWLAATRDSRDTLLRPHAEPRQRAEEGSYSEVLRLTAVRRALVVVVLTAPAVGFVYNWYAQLLVERMYEGQNDLWRYLWLPPLFFEVGAVGFGWLARERSAQGQNRALVVVGALLVGALCLVPQVQTGLAATALAGVAMIGAGAIHVLATVDMLARVPAPMATRAGAVTSGAQTLVFAVTAPLIGTVIDSTRSYVVVLVVVGALALPGAIAWALWPRGATALAKANVD
jgi:ACS family hexuronate transporter-like MFS transporter